MSRPDSPDAAVSSFASPSSCSSGATDRGTSPRGDSPQILIRGARTHNLKNIDLDLPRHQLVVITGLSGS
ncbi:hypothetical protein ACJEKQ_25370, partial [Escherichia coli]